MIIARVVRTAKVTGPCYTRLVACAVLFSLVSSFFSSAANAASINYGNFGPVPPGVSFLQVTESSGTDPVPLYGPPTPFSVGIDFDPQAFTATSSGGGAPDITDGQLNFTIMGASNPNGSIGIGSVNLFEAGDYTLFGSGGAGTAVAAGAIIRATITAINGSAIAPLALSPVNASFSDTLPPSAITAPWSLGLFLDIASQLPGLGYGPNDVATKVEVVIDNTLLSSSEANSLSFIAKKDFRITIFPDPSGMIPEPTTFVLGSLLVGLVGLTTRRRS
jgi:hypothetical protein